MDYGAVRNPYGVPDQVVQSNAQADGSRFQGDLRSALQNTYNFAIGDDLRDAADPSQSATARLWQAGSAALTVVTLPGAPEALGLKLAAKETIKGGVEQRG